jgi:hypothetical protein
VTDAADIVNLVNDAVEKKGLFFMLTGRTSGIRAHQASPRKEAVDLEDVEARGRQSSARDGSCKLQLGRQLGRETPGEIDIEEGCCGEDATKPRKCTLLRFSDGSMRFTLTRKSDS